MPRNFVTSLLVSEDEISKMLSEISGEDTTELRKASSDFFTRFGLGILIDTGQFFQALDRGEEILHLCHKLDGNLYSRMHKGLPFYFMGLAAYRIHDYVSAIYYIDAAVSEDLKNEPDNKDTPARLFLRLEGQNDNQAAKYVVQHVQQRVEYYIGFYNQLLEAEKSGFPQFNISALRKFLLEPAASATQSDTRSLATTFVTFFAEFDYIYYQLMIRDGPGTNEPFFMHLFKGCVLFESILKKNPSNKIKGGNLQKVLQALSQELGLPQKLNIGAARLENALWDAAEADDSIASKVVVTGKLRNTIGHNLGWPDQVTTRQYICSFQAIVASCLHAISVLYRFE